MPQRPQFSLKEILAIITLLSLPMTLMAVQHPVLRSLGVAYGVVFLGGSVGYLINGWKGAGIGAFLAFAICCLTP